MAQPTQRSSLTTLTRVRLLELADAPRPSFADLLDALKRDGLKHICRPHALDAGALPLPRSAMTWSSRCASPSRSSPLDVLQSLAR